MDIQKIIKDSMKAKRLDDMQASEQLTIKELLLMLNNIRNRDLPIVLDNGTHIPSGFDSWRGSYCELAMNYDGDSGVCYDQPKEDCVIDKYGDHSYDCPCNKKEYSTKLSGKPSVQEVIDVLEMIIGKYFQGYKGGDFTMGNRTPIWVANCGVSSGYKEKDEIYTQAIVDVVKDKNVVRIITDVIDF